jgi:hypothetical protein
MRHCRSGRKAVEAVNRQASAQFTAKPQVMQMRQRFAYGKSGLVRVKLAFKKNSHGLHGSHAVVVEGLAQVVQSVLVVLQQLANTLVQAGEWFAMRGKHQAIGRQVSVSGQ